MMDVRSRRLYRLLAIALAVMLPVSAVCAATEPKEKDPIADQAEDALWWGDLDTLDRLYQQATANPAVNAFNGRSAVASVRTGVARVFGYRDTDELYFRELDRLTAQWAKHRPDSVFAQLLHARALYARAWHVRGDGYWNTVPQPAQREFSRLIGLAERQLADRAPRLIGDTSTHMYLLMIGRSAGWSRDKMRIVAEDALSKSTRDEDVIYDELVTALMPKWGGSWPDLVAFIDETHRRTRERRGHELYALLYSEAAYGVTGNLFRELPARWLWIKEGLEALASRYQFSFYANRLAYFACLAEDRTVAAQWVRVLADNVELRYWSGGGSRGRQNYESCVRWLKQPAAPAQPPDLPGPKQEGPTAPDTKARGPATDTIPAA